MNETFEFTETPYFTFTWKDDPATEKQIAAIKEMWEFSDYPLPSLDLKVLTKGKAKEYMDKYHHLAHEDVNSPIFGY